MSLKLAANESPQESSVMREILEIWWINQTYYCRHLIFFLDLQKENTLQKQ